MFDVTTPAPPVCWRARFPEEVTNDLVSWDNPRGSVTNSDLELAGVVAQHDVVARTADVRHTTVATWGDNTPSVAWTTRGSVSRNCPAAYLLRLLALHRRHYRYSTAISHIAGMLNGMADDCSRLWQLTDAEFLHHMNTTYPQKHSWQLYQLPGETLCALISALSKTRSPPESWLNATTPTPASGPRGPSTAATWGYHPTSSDLQDPVPLLQVFTHRVRRGDLAHNGAPVRARTAEAYLRAVGQTFARMGTPDPRLNTLRQTRLPHRPAASLLWEGRPPVHPGSSGAHPAHPCGLRRGSAAQHPRDAFASGTCPTSRFST